jgi:hypothetical protein
MAKADYRRLDESLLALINKCWIGLHVGTKAKICNIVRTISLHIHLVMAYMVLAQFWKCENIVLSLLCCIFWDGGCQEAALYSRKKYRAVSVYGVI